MTEFQATQTGEDEKEEDKSLTGVEVKEESSPQKGGGDQDGDTSSPSKETSLLFGPYAIWVWIAFLIVASWFRFLPLIIIGTFLLLLTLSVVVWKKRALVAVQPVVRLNKTRLFVDEEILVEGSLFNNKWLPLVWIELEFIRSNGFTMGEGTSGKDLIRFLWLLAFQHVQFTIKGKVFKRGVYDLGEIVLRSGDGFRLAEIEERHHLDQWIYVYPKLLDVYVPNDPLTMQWGTKGKQGGFIEDPLMINGIRDYQTGDQVRRINWKASSRMGKLQTNQYQPIVNKQLFLYVDVHGFVINETLYEDPLELQKYVEAKTETFESFLSIVASVVVRYKEQGIELGFASNGLTNAGKIGMPIAPTTNVTAILDQFAQLIQPVRKPNIHVLNSLLQTGILSSPLFIFCEHVTEALYIWYEHNKNKLNRVHFFYKRETIYAEKLGSKASHMGLFLRGAVDQNQVDIL